MKRTTSIVTAALAAVCLALPAQATHMGSMSAINTGFATARSLADTPVSSVIPMDGVGGTFDRLTVLMTVVWGDSTVMNVKLQVSSNGTDYFWVQRCTSATIHNCGDRIWRWTPEDGTAPALDIATCYPFVKIQFDDPNDGTGTIVASVIRSKQ
jgi:hypothetical protein